MVHCISLAYWFVFYLLRKRHDESQTKLLDIDKVYVSCVIHHNLCVHPHICLEHLYLWCIQFRLTAPNANAQPNHEERHFLPLRVWSCSQYLEDMQPYQDPRIIVRHARAFAGGPEPRARERPALKKKCNFIEKTMPPYISGRLMGTIPTEFFSRSTCMYMHMQEKSVVASYLPEHWTMDRDWRWAPSSLALTESLEETKWEPMQCKQPYHGSLCICRGTERRTATGKLFRRCRRRRAWSITVWSMIDHNHIISLPPPSCQEGIWDLSRLWFFLACLS
jgi:hypothetical protein